jgi:hypothetical protein
MTRCRTSRLRAWLLAGGLVCTAAWSTPARADAVVWTLLCFTARGASTMAYDSATDCNAHRVTIIDLCADPTQAKTGPQTFTDVCAHPEHGHQCDCVPHTVADATATAHMWALFPEDKTEWRELSAAFDTLIECEASRGSFASAFTKHQQNAGRPGRFTIKDFACRPDR